MFSPRIPGKPMAGVMDVLEDTPMIPQWLDGLFHGKNQLYMDHN